MRVACVAAFACLALALLVPGSARSDYVTGIHEPLLSSADPTVRDRWFDEAVSVRAGIVRLGVGWRGVVSGPPADPANPADPAYDFSSLDAQVQDAAERGLRPLVVFSGAPQFAEGPGRPEGAPLGSWLPDPVAFEQFARATATRYSGSFGGLPRVSLYETWNEPNLWLYLSPQWRDGEPVAAQHYLKMQNAMYRGVHAVHPDNVSIAGSQAPYGDPPGNLRTRPLQFLREILCLSKRLKEVKCAHRLRFDVMSHHPINLSGPPRQSAVHPDDASSPDLKNVVRVLRAAEKHGTIAGKKKRHPVWVTEFWWESFPDGPHPAIPGLKKHGRWIQEAMYLWWKQGASVAVDLLLIDQPLDRQNPESTLQSGLLLEDETPKPAYTAFRFPFVTERRSKSKLFAWGKAPASGKLTIERKQGGGWKRVERLNVKDGKVFTAKLTERGKATYRARIGGETSLAWKQGKQVDKVIEPSKLRRPAADQPAKVQRLAERPPG